MEPTVVGKYGWVGEQEVIRTESSVSKELCAKGTLEGKRNHGKDAEWQSDRMWQRDVF